MTDSAVVYYHCNPYGGEIGSQWHDWRLWERKKVQLHSEIGQITQYDWEETWYCTRCRLIETKAGGRA